MKSKNAMLFYAFIVGSYIFYLVHNPVLSFQPLKSLNDSVIWYQNFGWGLLVGIIFTCYIAWYFNE